MEEDPSDEHHICRFLTFWETHGGDQGHTVMVFELLDGTLPSLLKAEGGVQDGRNIRRVRREARMIIESLQFLEQRQQQNPL